MLFFGGGGSHFLVPVMRSLLAVLGRRLLRSMGMGDRCHFSRDTSAQQLTVGLGAP